LPNKFEHQDLIRRVGAKAANLGLLNLLTLRLNLPSVSSPASLGVPFNFYEKFIQFKQPGKQLGVAAETTTLAAETEKILQKYDLLNTEKIHATLDVKQALAEIKALYEKATVPPELLKIFKKYIFDDPTSPVHISKHPRLRLRSSTNSEDMEGFTGAGLYDSDGVSLYKKNKADGTYDRSKPLSWEEVESKLMKTLRFLYSSVWNERAFQEREWYQMNGRQHLDIKVGLAFHGAFPLKGFQPIGEVANGVAVTTNIHDPSEWGKIYINAQHYDLAVTNPPTPEEFEEVGEPKDQVYTTEEILVTTYTADDTYNTHPNNWKRWPVEKLGTTSVRGGEDVLKGEETLKLARAFWLLNKEMGKVYKKAYDKFPVDIEWKIYGPERNLLIKQVRPFTPPKANE
jgi:hypothetical protein